MTVSIQERLDKLKEIEYLCQVLIKQENEPPFTQKEWLTGRADAAKMILEIINRKGAMI